ncbi:D-aminoacyl-tRNA deacylase [Arenibacter antarcticus]|uniref:D-aminoacyl-tRNA deacylase n=1 Tax=Arenibacter antarcticus TaxID=2040469 RepID=A0ABW5VDG1_9FLAO|nr:D-aminoacyl-tRNA deacylase [Arenibacter sp. H213]MCM4169424.1 D-tyrosyl-tRNA(Tyr) deacylase [Arenibacter sp. H213]
MRAVIQRVSQASVTVEGKLISEISKGLLVLLGIEEADGEEDVVWLSKKMINLRVFDDVEGVMNESLLQVDGGLIIVSQFTLQAAVKKGNRPSYLKAAKPDIAIPLYERFIAQVEADLGKKVGTGVFGANMKVALINDGPVTIQIDTKNRE